MINQQILTFCELEKHSSSYPATFKVHRFSLALLSQEEFTVLYCKLQMEETEYFVSELSVYVLGNMQDICTPHLACVCLFWALNSNSLQGNGKGPHFLDFPKATAAALVAWRLVLVSGLPCTKPCSTADKLPSGDRGRMSLLTLLPVSQLRLQL